jgi:hypothetical protein
MNTPKVTWFGVSDDDDVTLNKAFLLAGIVSADAGLCTVDDLSSLKAGVQRRIAPTRVGATHWAYPDLSAKPTMAATASDLAKIYDDIYAKRGDDWAKAVRLEVPVTVTDEPKIGGVSGVTPDQIYGLLGIEPGDGTHIPIALTFTAVPPRSHYAFNWPMRVATAGKAMQDAWAVKNGYVGIVHPDDAQRFDTGGPATGVDLYLDHAPDAPDGALNSVVTIPNMDMATFGMDEWQRLKDMGAVVVPNVGRDKLDPWLDELTRAITHDRPFDVAVFEAWHRSGRKTPPMLVAWEGAFDKAKLSTLVRPTIRALRGYPATHPVTIPGDVARDLGVPTAVPAGRLAKIIEDAVKSGARPMQFDRDKGAGTTLGSIRQQLRGFVPFGTDFHPGFPDVEPLAGSGTGSPSRGAAHSPRRAPPASSAAATDAVTTDVHEEAFSPTSPSALESAEAAAAPPRFINAWLEDGTPPLAPDRPYTLAINIGRLRDQTLASEPLARIDWGDKTSLMLLCVVSGHGASISPGQRTFELTPAGDTEKIPFTITARRADAIALRISLYLARELTLLEEFEVSIAVQKAKAA